jgi:TPR repeat protein
MAAMAMNLSLRSTFHFVVCAFFCIAWTACDRNPVGAHKDSVEPLSKAMQITESEKKYALSGNGVAARDMASIFVDNNYVKAKYWIMVGAENGDDPSEYNYALLLLNESKNKDDDAWLRAVFWLKRSASSGNEYAKEKLVEIEKQK